MVIKTKAQWDKLEQPLKKIDNELNLISEEKGFAIEKNHQNWPNRSLIWTSDDGLSRKVEIALEKNMVSFEIFGYVWFDDSNGKRFIKILHQNKNIKPPLKSIITNEIIIVIDLLLKIGKSDLNPI